MWLLILLAAALAMWILGGAIDALDGRHARKDEQQGAHAATRHRIPRQRQGGDR